MMQLRPMLKPVEYSDVARLAATIRTADREELVAATGSNVMDVVLQGAKDSTVSFATYVDGKLLAIWGVVDLYKQPSGASRPGWGWLLTTTLVEKYPKLFYQLSKKLLGWVLTIWTTIENAIDVRHEQALRWGRRLGFSFYEPAPFEASGLMSSWFIVSKESYHVQSSRTARRRRRGRRNSGSNISESSRESESCS